MQRKFAIAIHGGAGTIQKYDLTEIEEHHYLSALQESLNKGYQVLEKSGSALDAVEASVRSLEDCPLFNAGRGSVFTHDGKIEMDASIMDGLTRDAGAIAMCSGIKNPISLARQVMEKTEHVFLAGLGANEFAEYLGLEKFPDEYFFTEHRWNQLQNAITMGKSFLDHSLPGKKWGTVGAVACDQNGNLAAATSTGGMTNKKFGRIGDSPIIGAGTYANNRSCAVSCTGSGEYFIREAVAFQVHALMQFAKLKLKDACYQVVQESLKEIGGDGGLIAINSEAEICFEFNTEGMYRGFRNSAGEQMTMIYS